jgi:hypothetical protein
VRALFELRSSCSCVSICSFVPARSSLRQYASTPPSLPSCVCVRVCVFERERERERDYFSTSKAVMYTTNRSKDVNKHAPEQEPAAVAATPSKTSKWQFKLASVAAAGSTAAGICREIDR